MIVYFFARFNYTLAANHLIKNLRESITLFPELKFQYAQSIQIPSQENIF